MTPMVENAVEYATTTAPESITGTVKRAWWAVVAVFLIHGLVVSTWVSRIPSVKNGLHLGDGVFGLSLFGSAIGSMVGIPLCGWYVAHRGSRSATIWTSAGLCLSLLLPAFAVNAVTLFLALAVFGAVLGANDVAMNSQAVIVERMLGTPWMSRFHAMFSIGGIAGSAVGGWLASQRLQVTTHFPAMTAIFLCLAFVMAPMLPHAARPEESAPVARLRLRQMPLALVALSAIGFCIFLSEGAMADWTAVYLRQVLNSGPGTAAAGYAVFSAAMAVFRMCGDAITLRLGFAATIRTRYEWWQRIPNGA